MRPPRPRRPGCRRGSAAGWWPLPTSTSRGWPLRTTAASASAVTVSEPVPLQRIASFHVDETDVADDDELLWYDVTELTGLLDLF